MKNKIDKFRKTELKYLCYQYYRLPENLKKLIEEAARLADPALRDYILASCTDGLTYDELKDIYEIPISRKTFYDKRNKFYWYLDKLYSQALQPSL